MYSDKSYQYYEIEENKNNEAKDNSNEQQIYSENTQIYTKENGYSFIIISD